MKPRLLDLFCGAGGAAMGYHRAGFEVVGVDIEPQPDYPFEFHGGWDAVEVLHRLVVGERLGLMGHFLSDLVAVHASPPCQAYTHLNQRYRGVRDAHPALIAPTRDLMMSTGLPYVIENVPGARSALDHPVQLCGSSFGLGVRRHRLFECSFPVMAPSCGPHDGLLPVYGKLDGRRLWTHADGSELRAAGSLNDARTAMGIHWMDWDELREAIPPAYTEHIGHYLMLEIQRQRTEAAA